MTNKEREQKMEELENRMFFLNMKDNWTNKDFESMREMKKEWNELKKGLDK